MSPWVHVTVPFPADSSHPSKCERFLPLLDNTTSDYSCSAEFFDSQTRIDCDDFVYEDDELTILNQVCHMKGCSLLDLNH